MENNLRRNGIEEVRDVGKGVGRTWVGPLHAVGVLVGCLEVVAAPAGVCEDEMGGCEARAGEGE